ncbi:MAG: MOSC N-terminal beta barrel domain-containing protein [Betaproteobacteria bacterium]
MSGTHIASLHVYPVKGCRGLAPTTAQMTATGLATHGAGDREWMIVDRAGHFITQRELPRLALIEITAGDVGLTLRVPDAGPVSIPYVSVGPSIDVDVWRHHGRGIDAGDTAASLLSTWLDEAVRLVRFDRAAPRACNVEFAGDSGAQTLFADGYPLLVVGAASLADLNARLVARGEFVLPMNRFRPNIVLAGLPTFDEDHLDTITMGAVTLRMVKPCVRCVVTTTDQATVQIGMEPLRTLGEYRMNERFGGVTFGMNAIVTAGAGHTLSCGDGADVTYRF